MGSAEGLALAGVVGLSIVGALIVTIHQLVRTFRDRDED